MSAAVRPQPGAVYRDDLLSGAAAAVTGRWVDTQNRPVSLFIEAATATGTTILLEGSFDAVTVHGTPVANVAEGAPQLRNHSLTAITDEVYPFLRYRMSAIGGGALGAAFMAVIP
jgi:hypothetical protein